MLDLHHIGDELIQPGINRFGILPVETLGNFTGRNKLPTTSFRILANSFM